MGTSKICLGITIILLLVALPKALAADIQLGAECSLADAITAANDDAAVAGCAAGAGLDTILLSENVLLDQELPVIKSALAIQGNDQFFISGDNRFRIFLVGPEGELTLRNLILARGISRAGGALCGAANGADRFGGAVCNLGALVILDSHFTRNAAAAGGAIFSQAGTLRISNSRFSDNTATGDGGALYLHEGSLGVHGGNFVDNVAVTNGGAIFSQAASIDIRASEFRSNQANDDGGAMQANGGEIDISGSVYDNNRTTDDGGALRVKNSILQVSGSTFSGNQAADNGGALHSNASSSRLNNSTFYANSAAYGGAISIADDDALIKHVTVVYNSASQLGGGIMICCESPEEVGHLFLRHSILAGNDGGDCGVNIHGVLEDSSFNLIGDGSCEGAPVDPQLGELIQPAPSGPAYYPLSPDSPALDAGDFYLCSQSDQIGTARPQGESCDIGAIEVAENSTPLDTPEESGEG
ncbi:MAG: hypothetical protein OXI62_10075 [Chloroflexota bacterium]|nr:hypothetical protein [Chloroflexota bacterium]MXX84810.1 hypothetical protein [Chloroflexota bacterium]MYA92015.1 hypothetical protein [Chloroflexota bacterium]MYC54056.1 hypothetical protein [Chloroflexota bacterium]MYD37481.1 hypothetical protein [Chloroflexota bacterium]